MSAGSGSFYFFRMHKPEDPTLVARALMPFGQTGFTSNTDTESTLDPKTVIFSEGRRRLVLYDDYSVSLSFSGHRDRACPQIGRLISSP